MNGFEVKRGIPLRTFKLDLLASKSSLGLLKGKMTHFILGTGVDAMDLPAMLNFSAESTQFAFENRNSLLPRGFGGSLLSVPTIVSESFPEELKEWVSKNLPKKH